MVKKPKEPSLCFVGGGIDIYSIAYLELLFLVSEKTAKAMSVVLMGVITTTGFL